jgi:hypothetical protein
MRKSILGLLLAGACVPAMAATPDNGGPYNAQFLQGGIGIERDLTGADALVRAGAAYTLSAWVRPDAAQKGRVVLVALGRPDACRCLALVDGRLTLLDGGTTLTGGAVAARRWTHVAAVADGRTVRLFIDGKLSGSRTLASAAVSPHIGIAPVWGGHFGGALVDAKADDAAVSLATLRATAANPPRFELVQMLKVGQGWEWQKTANTGYWQQQDPWTLPQAKGPGTKPVAKPVVAAPALAPLGEARWQVNGWRLISAEEMKAGGAALSRPGNAPGKWLAATVPGTVLTTLVDRGVYPDPYYGLNNLQIPESLSRQDWWYRTSFTAPEAARGRKLSLVFNGINYASEIWVNGERIGETHGAFTRGRFPITAAPGENVVAVRVSPPPHPGLPHEQSIKAGVGLNGGQLAIDGPTFVATEGWDWIPGIRDRDTGIWQPVELQAQGDLAIGDPQIVTDLPLPRTDSADIHIRVPVTNHGTQPLTATVTASFDGISVEQKVTVAPGTTFIAAFSPDKYPQLRVANPRLWWPNGYGEQALHNIAISVASAGQVSDQRQVRFGIREVSYDLSLFDSKGALRRVNVQTTDGGLRHQKLIDVTHFAIKQSPRGWVESLTPAGEISIAVTDLGSQDTLPEPHLTLRVNGVKIAARGGSWGMDDAMKRIGRDRLEPYFRLEKEANMNIIRNWMGNNTEPEFYDLADEYGLMILNDFWQSTQNFQVEPEDPQLFLANARDVIARYRNHPSIVVWFGRNEGVPYPLLNEGLDDAVAELDGTRWYTGSSNTINLQGSGPYDYRPPAGYFTDLATGFSVETGTPSLATQESIESYVPEADRWPISDTLAYHDWHFSGNGDTHGFMKALDTMFGPATSLQDFERKAQMMNLETHKAMVEGFLGHLWSKNSGRLFWMTHPSWPSNAWQLYSWDYDTHAAYYGAKKAAEPVHIQLNLPDNALVVLNTTQGDLKGLTATTRVVGLDNAELFRRSDAVDARANRATPLPAVPLDQLFTAHPMVLVSLRLTDAAGRLVADNFYWRGKDQAAYRALNDLPQADVSVSPDAPVLEGKDRRYHVTVENRGKVPVLNLKIGVVDAHGQRILPAYFTDNYLSLLPGERRELDVRYPASITTTPYISYAAWNLDGMEAQGIKRPAE